MRFRLLKANQRRTLAHGPEFLEPRRYLAAAGFTALPVDISAQEGSPVANQPVAQITNQPIGVGGVMDYAATIDWGDGTPASLGQIVSTPQAGVFQVLGSHTYADEGTDSIRTTISKDGGAASSFTATATVSDPPIAASAGYTVLAVEGIAPADQLLATFTDPGGPEDPSNYTASVDWGDGSVTPAVVAFNSALGAFVVTGGAEHNYSLYGTNTVAVTITHDNTTPVTVNDLAIVSDADLIGQGGFTYTGSEGATTTAQTLATFSDPGGAQGVAHYSATIDWGDGDTLPGTVQATGNGQFAVVGTHAYVEEGRGAITVVLNHDISSPVTITSAYSISDPAVRFAAAPLLNIAEGTPLTNVVLGTFADPGGPEDVGDYSIQIDWGDGTVSPGIVSFSASNNIFTVTGNHVYLTSGVHNTRLIARHDVALPDATQVGSITVSDVPVVGTGGFTVSGVEGSLTPNQTIATFTDPGGTAPLTEYAATIDWGDGTSPTSGTISFDSGSQVFSVQAQHVFGEEGTFPIKITLAHDQATAVTVAGVARVSDPAVVAVGSATISALEYRAFASQPVALFTDPGGGESATDYSATILWGDGSISPGQIVSSSGSFSVLASHPYSQFGVYRPTVTIHHDAAPDVTVSDTVNVGAPATQLSALPITWRELTVPVELSPLARLSFTDSQMTALIGWGDGATSAGVITPDLVGSTGTVRGSHLYTEAGNYTMTITIADGPQTTSQTFPITVMRELLPIANTDAGTPTQYYVAEVYGDVLGRAVDGGGLQYWSNLLDRGAPRASVTNALLSSDEYLANFVIGPAYAKYLGRAADPAGVQYWISQMHRGLTDQGLVAALASSPEFFSNSGGTNASFVGALYQSVLGRPADAAGATFWTGQLAAGASRFNVALSFAISAEDVAETISGDFEHLLDRAPSLSELNQWVSAFTRGAATNESLIASLAATDEYFAHAISE
jgi:large repetitive protein